MSRSSLEALALQSVAARYGWAVHRSKDALFCELGKTLGDRFWEDDLAEGENLTPKDLRRLYFADIFGDFRRVPDGWVVVPTGKPGVVATVVAVEVEDTHRLSREKLLDYGYLWWGFDGTEELDFHLLAVDRYGDRETWFDMTAVGYLEIFRGEPRHKSAQLSGGLVVARPAFARPSAVPA